MSIVGRVDLAAAGVWAFTHIGPIGPGVSRVELIPDDDQAIEGLLFGWREGYIDWPAMDAADATEVPDGQEEAEG